MLRYNYIMEVTAQAQGDFARTSDNWANQIRVLKQQFQELIGVLGSGFIRVLTPVVRALNDMLATLINIANAMAISFGGTGIEKTTANVSSSVGDLNDSANGTADGFENANTQAKALAKTIAGFDELNILNKSTESTGEILGDLSNNLGASGYGDAVVDEISYDGNIKKFKDYIEELKEILDKWVVKIPKLDFSFDTEAAIESLKQIGKNILNVIAGWGSFIISIGIEVANDLKIGRLANDLLDLIQAITNVASAFTDVFAPALLEFYKTSGLSEIVKAVGNVLHEALQGVTTAFNGIATWIKENKQEINDVVAKFAELSSVFATLILQMGDNVWSGFSKTLTAMSQILNGISFKEFSNLVITFTAISAAATTATIVLKKLWDVFIGSEFRAFSLGAALKELPNIFGAISDMLFDFFGGNIFDLLNRFDDAVRSLPNTLLLAFTGLFDNIKKIFGAIFDFLKAIPAQIKKIFTSAGGFLAPIIAEFKTAEGLLGKIKVALDLISGGFSKLFGLVKAHPFAAFVTALIAAADGIRRLWDDSEAFREAVTQIWISIKDGLVSMVNSVKDLFVNHLKPIFEQLGDLFGMTGGKFEALWDVFSKVVGWMATLLLGTFTTTVVNTFVFLVETITNIIAPIADILTGLLMFINGVFSGNLEKAGKGIKYMFEGVINAILSIGKSGANALIRIINGVVNGIVGAMNGLIESLNKIKIPEWVPKIGGKNLNWAPIKVANIPYLANGGVITQPTMAMVGEYAGASHNPEIVTPQSLLQSVIESSNDNVVNALIQQTKQLITALENIDMNVSIGDDVIAQSAYRGNQAYKRRTGRPLLA